MAENNIRVGDIGNVGGDLIVAGRDVHKGYTAEQVSALLVQISSTFQPKQFDGRCPYKGLDIFQEEDADLFFGREKLVDELLTRVGQSRVIFIGGPSGSGKSSLARAGLIHALKHGRRKDLHSERWLYETMKPGREPINELARVAASLAGSLNAAEDIRSKSTGDATVLAQWCEIALKEGRDKRAVILVDQFEEVFTQVSREEERQAFLQLITHAATVENGRIVLLFAMRSDFVPNCAAYPALNELLNRNFVQIGAMQPHELVAAMARPALQVGLRIDPDLISRIINEMEGEPDALPLMQFALKDLFDAQQGQGGIIALTLNDYLKRGGIHKALERHADAEFSKLTKAEQAITENLFKGLVEIGRNAPDTRRIAQFDEFASPEMSFYSFESVVMKLADARLISTDEDQVLGRTITLAHEKLIEAWPWLRKLVNDNRMFIQVQNQILEDALEWEKHGKDRSYLYSGTRLASVQRTMRDFQIKNEKARVFLRACQKAYRRTRLQRILITGLLLVMAVAMYRGVILPLLKAELTLQPVELGGAGVNAMQMLPDGTIYAGMYNSRLKKEGLCLARLNSGSEVWEKFGPPCKREVVALWVNPTDPSHIYFSQYKEPGLYRSVDGGSNWARIKSESGLPLEFVSSLVGTPNGLLFAGDLANPIGVYKSSDEGKTWSSLEGSPAEPIFTLSWVPEKGLLVGGKGGLWLWKESGEWQQLIVLDTTQTDQSINSVTVVPADKFTILAGGDEGIYIWKEGDPVQTKPKNRELKKAWNVVFVARPEPYVIASTFPDTKIWRLTTDAKDPVPMKAVGSDGFPMIVQSENPLRLWVGTVDHLYVGELRKKGSELMNSK